MSVSSEELRAELRRGVDTMRMLRDEIRVHVHLASTDALQKWTDLEPRILEVETLAHRTGEEARTAVHEAVRELRELRDAITSL